MKKENYHVYCKEILGVKTNISDFKWVYGRSAPCCTVDEYESCAIKFSINVMPEKSLEEYTVCDNKFQSYVWDNTKKTLFYRRTLFSVVKIGYNIRISGNNVEVCVGSSYLKYVKNRVMNLHGMYYLLSDIANMMLLKNGFLTLYASSVYCNKNNRGAVFFAPPNTGKTLTAVSLLQNKEFSFVGEDIAVTDGERLYSCPYTCSYREKASKLDSESSIRHGTQREDFIKDARDVCDLTDVFVLSIGKRNITADSSEAQRKIRILNGYLFNYYSSPIIKILGFFENDIDKGFNEYAAGMIREISERCSCHLLSAEKPTEFSELARDIILEQI